MALLPKKDVVVVGYGAAAGPVTLELARAGHSVVVLEKGPMLTTEDDFQRGSLDTLRWITRGAMLPPDQPDLTFRNSENAVAQPARYRMASTVGGSSVHWSGQSWRYYVDDFKVKSTINEMYNSEGRLGYLAEDRAAIEDWPIRYEEVEPFYEKVEYNIGVGGWPGNIDGRIRPVNANDGNPYEAPRKKDYPFRPLRDNATDMVFRRGATELGLKPFHVPTAITTEPWKSAEGVERAGCTYCSFCTGHGCWNGSKSSSLVATLPLAQQLSNFELRPNSNVLKINHRDGRAVSVTYIDEDGIEQEQPGDIFILGAYSFQNVRLLLHSGINGNGQVGKYFMNRASTSIAATWSDLYLNGWNGPAVQRQGLDDFNGENHSEEKLRLPRDQFFVRGAFIGSPSQRLPLESYNIRPNDVPRWGAGYKDFLAENLNKFMALQLLQEPMPYEDGSLDLDPTYRDRNGMPAIRVTRPVKNNERRMARFVYEKAERILRAAGANRVWGSSNPVSVAVSTHDLGGCRMGSDPTKSVTNRYCQMWTMPNIFIGGGAVAPTMSGHNPTETIWMLSYWMADAITRRKVNLNDARAFT